MGRRAFWLALVLLLVLPWFGYRHLRDWLRPDASRPVAEVAVPVPAVDAPAPAAGAADGAPLPLLAAPPERGTGDASAQTATGEDAAAQVDAIGRDARAGDADAAAARLAGVGARVHRDVLLADRGSAVRREDARRGLAEMPGVRAAGWIDRMTVLLLMSRQGSGYATLGEACRRLAAHGDVTGLAVRVQEVAGDDVAAGALLGECSPGLAWAPSAVGQALPFPGTLLHGRGVAGSAGADGAAGEEDPEAAAERRRREQESLRILSESTPELPVPPQPGPPR